MSPLPLKNPSAFHSSLGPLIAVLACVAASCGRDMAELAIPNQLILEDFLSPLDRSLTRDLLTIERLGLPEELYSQWIAPFVDEVQELEFASTGVLVQEGSFPDHPALLAAVQACAEVLHLEDPPKVYVLDRPGASATIANLADPVILLHSSLLRRFRSPAELRFIVGREMGHIACGHQRLLFLKKSLVTILPSGLDDLSLSPLYRWILEAEMSADRAGLLCAQDLPAVENTLLKLLLNVDQESVGEVDVDRFLSQSEMVDWGEAAEIVHFARELKKAHPFVPHRIRELRAYADSPFYLRIWD